MEKGFHMMYLKITCLLLTLSIFAAADTSRQNEATESAPESTIFNSISALFSETTDFLSQLFNEWFDENRDSTTEQPPEPIQISTTSTEVETRSADTQDVAKTPNQDLDINEKISQLEERRLALEAKRIAAEEKRLAAAEKRLAAAEKRLAAEQERLALEEKKLQAKTTPQTQAIAKAVIEEKSIDSKKDKSTQIEKQARLSENTIKKTAKAESYPEPKEQKKLKSVVAITKNAAFIKLENQYYLDLYQWELKSEIYRLVKYPDWAKSLGKTGNVSLDFTVHRNARVSDVSGDNSHISIQLVSELHRAIITAAKSVLPPDALPGDSWNMNITYNFQPHDVEQVALQKPVKPVFLEEVHGTVLIDDDNNLEKYQKDVQNIIADRIEYPVWAEKLKQRGKVSFEIVINQDGSIAEIKPKDVNRHMFLNQEVLRAINDSAPLPSIPEHLRLQSTNMVIQHEFKK
jgi:outer membrane biosynthesis protein TonB